MPSYSDFLETHKVMLAPMAGVTDVAFRRICKEQGASLAFTEMVSAKGLSYANERTARLVDLFEGEDEVGVQIFGHEPDTMAEQAKWIERELGKHLCVIDVNMGCPVRKIAGKGDGAALIKDPGLAERIVGAVAEAVSVPVTLKTRRGFYEGEETCVDFARLAQRAGAAAIAIHGRYATQMYRGAADWGCIARAKEAVDIPVIGNGDVFSAQDAVGLLDATSCDAILVARGAQGNPWLFGQIRALLEGGAPCESPTPLERIQMARRHTHLLADHHPKAVVRMRKHASWYVKGIPGASAARAAFNACSTAEEFDQAFDALVDRLAEAGAGELPAGSVGDGRVIDGQ